MHQKLKAWLNSPSDKPGSTNLGRLAELIAVNRGTMDIMNIGSTPNDSVWGRVGLTSHEALELTGMVNYVSGVMYGTGDQDYAEIQLAVQNEIARREKGAFILLATPQEQLKFGKQYHGQQPHPKHRRTGNGPVNT